MKSFRWGIISIIFSLLFLFNSFAEEIRKDDDLLKDAKVSFHAEIDSEEMLERRFLFGLYSEEGEPLGFKAQYVKDWEKSFNVEFLIPEYSIGEAFYVKLMEDSGEIEYNGEKGKKVKVNTYVYQDAEGNARKQTTFYGKITPGKIKKTDITLYGNKIKDDFFILDNKVFVSEDFIKELRIDISKEEDLYILKSENGICQMTFRKGKTKAVFQNEEISLNYPLMIFEEKAYFPLYEVGIYFACNYIDESTEDTKIIKLDYSHYANVDEKERFINSSGIESKTEYLIFIKKDDFTVNVYTGEKGFWHLYKSYPCALGAKNSPTVEGEFEYEEFIERWNYDVYYCGPVIRFYRGYALHSTLIRYNGNLYDDRVGVEISHGCIRLHPEDINHLAEIIPLGTKIYITK